ncbi:hypothetical protein NM208_g6546 [Fusarium decemcellulare]|uniref:Uncharacterized protein n=1 Tax=Fusarium decemcellulare TaxID=57161 RepID=A0ACC1SCJ6_9HYPO|nr:hypothetical protein NM208_g6546 [Fusarium decemcellulare]
MHFPGVALVTGAASGIGRATVRLFAREGCKRIVIADVNPAGLETLKLEIEQQHTGVKIAAIPTNVTSEGSVVALIKSAVQRFGRIDYACNVAGILLPGPSTDYSVSDWDKIFSVNTRGTWLCQREELIQMLKQDPLKADDSDFEARGAIANVASMAGIRGEENLPAYCATKFAVVGFTKADGLRYGRDKIRLNAICPGVIKTPMLGDVPESDDNSVDGMTKQISLQRQGQPEEVAECLVWIVSGRASFVNATTLAPCGETTICEHGVAKSKDTEYTTR